MKTIENNKLIADFMGIDKVNDRFYLFALKEGFVKQEICAANLEYHLSWDWLMPVVKKIYLLSTTNETIKHELQMWDKWQFYSANIDVTYNTVLDFIKKHS